MTCINIERMNLVSPWEIVIDNKYNIESELQKELSENHALYGLKSEVIAKRVDQDEYLIYLPEHTHKFAVVHLTWSSRCEKDKRWPRTRLYTDIEEWKIRCMVKDYLDYADEISTFKVIQAYKRIELEVALYGNYMESIKPGVYLLNTLDLDIVFKVKGIEVLNYIDKSKSNINPWVLVESNRLTADEFMNMEFYIIS